MPTGRWWLALAAATLIAAALRVPGIAKQPLWEDEAQTYWIVTQSSVRIVQHLSRDCSPPLYYLLLHAWLRVAPPTEALLRAPSALVGILTVPLLALAATRIGGSRLVGLGAATVLAVSPLHVWHSQETRMYALLVLLGLGSGWGLHHWQKGGHWVRYVLPTVLALHTHHFALYLVGAQAIWFCFRRPPADWRIALPVLGLLYLPSGWLLWTQTVVNTTGGWIDPPRWDALARTFGLLSLGVRADERLVVAGVPLLVVLGAAVFVPVLLVGARWWARRAPLFVWLTGVPPLLAFAVSQVVPSYTTGRYDVLVLGFYAIVLSGAMTTPRRFLLAASAIAALETVPLAYYHLQYRKSAARELAEAVMAREEPGDLIVVAPEIHYSPFRFYYRGSCRCLPLPDGASGGVVDYSDYARRWTGDDVRRSLEQLRDGYRGGRIFLVWSPYKDTLLFREQLLRRFQLAERLQYSTGSGYVELNILKPRDGTSVGVRDQPPHQPNLPGHVAHVDLLVEWRHMQRAEPSVR